MNQLPDLHFQRARSRLYRSQSLQVNSHFCRIFRDLQDSHAFAPLRTQILVDFRNFRKISAIFPDFAKFCREQTQIAHFSTKISRNFFGISGICSNAVTISWFFLISRIISWNFEGAKGRQAAKWNWSPFPSDSAEPYQLRMTDRCGAQVRDPTDCAPLL